MRLGKTKTLGKNAPEPRNLQSETLGTFYNSTSVTSSVLIVSELFVYSS